MTTPSIIPSLEGALLLPAGRELDAKLAELCLGWRWICADKTRQIYYIREPAECDKYLPEYVFNSWSIPAAARTEDGWAPNVSIDIAAAWELLDGFDYGLQGRRTHFCSLDGKVCEIAETAPMAICRARLQLRLVEERAKSRCEK